MKKFSAVLAAAALVGVASAFAASPFSDVPTTSWAYQAVAQLAAQGIINGYPNGTFQGQKDITRYEVAQMVAKAMVYQDRANAEQQATINRLAQEFSSELNTLGVRVGNVESRLDNVKWTGEAKADYNHEAGTNMDKWTYEGNLVATAKVNDNTKAVAKLTYGKTFGDTDTTGLNAKIDKLYVEHNFGGVVVDGGRFSVTSGDNGFFLDGKLEGVLAQANLTEGVSLAVGHGYGVDSDSTVTLVNGQAQLAQGLTAQGFYLQGNKNAAAKVYGGGLAYAGEGFGVQANVYKVQDKDHSSAYMVQGTLGSYNQATAGTWDATLAYARVGSASADPSGHDFDVKAGQHGFVGTVNYALAPNVGLKVQSNFAVKTNDGDKKAANDKYKVELSYQF